MYRIGWFSTGRDKAARDLLATVWDSIQSGHITAQIAFVFSNREPAESRQSDLFFQLVRSYNIPLTCLSSQEFQAQRGKGLLKEAHARLGWRLEYDHEIMRRLEDYPADLYVLAGYMLIVGEEMCEKYPMLNLHPAAPGGPTGTWQEVIWKLIESKASQTGAMMHLVSKELDKGPPVTYCTFSIRGEPFDRHWQEIEGYAVDDMKAQQGENNPLFRTIRQHGLAREFPLIVATLKAFSEGRVRIEGGKVLDANGQPIEGYCLTQEIDEIVKEKLAQ
jgi:folate-dependent phosphoribosylglycinamide formyltransferase PurN